MKRIYRYAMIALSAVALSGAMTSCDDDDDDDDVVIYEVFSPANFSTITYDTEGVWSLCNATNPVATLNIGEFTFSHTVDDTWGAPYAYGFTPSRSTDSADYPDAERYNHRWAAITAGGIDYKGATVAGSPYMLGILDAMESLTEIPAAPVCKISMRDGDDFEPESIMITNSAYAYWSMKKGDNFLKAFSGGDFTDLLIIGVKNGVKTATVKVSLAKGNDVLDSWTSVSLRSLGEVDYIYFQIDSSAKNQFGLLVPAYFCFDRLAYRD